MAIDKKTLEALHAAVLPSRYLEYRDYLQAVYTHLKDHLTKYSYVQFAEDLGLSRSNVAYLIIKGQRPLTNKAGEKIAEHLVLSGLEKNYFRILVQYKNAATAQQQEELFQKLVALKSQTLTSINLKSQLDFFSEWYHIAIYELIALPSFQSDPNWIADHLQPRVRPEQARKSLQLLEALKLIRWDKEKCRHVPTQTRVTTGDEIASVAIIRYHHKAIEIGKESITQVAEDLRDISSITMALPSDLIPKLKEEISLFRKKLLALAEGSPYPDTVYQMNVQLFPLSKPTSES